MALTGLTQLQPTNINVTGIATFEQTVGIAGTLTYEDVTNIDSVGVVTARVGVNVPAGQLDVGSNVKIGHSGVTTASNFKTGTTNVHSVGVEAAGINVLGADTPIGAGATIYNSGGADFTGVVTATNFKKSDGSDVGAATVVTIGVRSGAAVTFSATGSSFNVSGRSGNIPISI